MTAFNSPSRLMWMSSADRAIRLYGNRWRWMQNHLTGVCGAHLIFQREFLCSRNVKAEQRNKDMAADGIFPLSILIAIVYHLWMHECACITAVWPAGFWPRRWRHVWYLLGGHFPGVGKQVQHTLAASNLFYFLFLMNNKSNATVNVQYCYHSIGVFSILFLDLMLFLYNTFRKDDLPQYTALK